MVASAGLKVLQLLIYFRHSAAVDLILLHSSTDEWNARVQITSWDPTPKGAGAPGRQTVDYASKHWSGLISDYYAARVTLVMNQALSDAKAGNPLNGKVCSTFDRGP